MYFMQRGSVGSQYVKECFCVCTPVSSW